MTNYEYLIKYNAELVKDILSRHLARVQGKPNSCLKACCANCDFYSETHFPCGVKVKEWLDDEHGPLYKKGDIVIDSNNQLTVVKEDYYDGDVDVIIVSHFVDNTIGIKENVTDIKKKIGHIEEGEVK